MSAMSSPAPVRSPEQPVPVLVPGRPRRSRGWLILLCAVLIVAGGYVAWRLVARKTPAQPAAAAGIKTAKAFVGPLTVMLRVTGQTSARNFANITAPILRGPENRGSLVLLELAKSGSSVRKGQLVAKLDAQSAQDHIDDVEDTVRAAENDVLKRQAEQKVEWENMQQTLRVTKAAYEKAKLDYSAAEVKTDVERELLKLSMDEAAARYQEQQKDVAQRKVSQDAEIKILQYTLERHRRHLGRHVSDLKRYTMYAPMDGLAVMATIFRGGEMGQVQQGDQVWPGQQIMKVVDPASMQVEASVSQSDSGDLRISQPVSVGFDAFPDMRFKGKVYSIGALAVGGWRQNFYIRTVPVRIMIEGSDPRLIPDLSAYGDVQLGTLPNKLQAPLAAVREVNGKAYVEVKRGDRFETREVVLGKRNNLNVAIESGLEAGDELKLN
jgi:HlyD family secretion protein